MTAEELAQTLGPRRGGFSLEQVSSWGFWYRHGHFKNDDQARGALLLAHQQFLDGMGKSREEWLGISSVEFAAWYDRDELPIRLRNSRKSAP